MKRPYYNLRERRHLTINSDTIVAESMRLTLKRLKLLRKLSRFFKRHEKS